MNCNVYDRLKYNPATPLFHQWRDEKRKVSIIHEGFAQFHRLVLLKFFFKIYPLLLSQHPCQIDMFDSVCLLMDVDRFLGLWFELYV